MRNGSFASEFSLEALFRLVSDFSYLSFFNLVILLGLSRSRPFGCSQRPLNLSMRRRNVLTRAGTTSIFDFLSIRNNIFCLRPRIQEVDLALRILIIVFVLLVNGHRHFLKMLIDVFELILYFRCRRFL